MIASNMGSAPQMPVGKPTSLFPDKMTQTGAAPAVQPAASSPVVKPEAVSPSSPAAPAVVPKATPTPYDSGPTSGPNAGGLGGFNVEKAKPTGDMAIIAPIQARAESAQVPQKSAAEDTSWRGPFRRLFDAASTPAPAEQSTAAPRVGAMERLGQLTREGEDRAQQASTAVGEYAADKINKGTTAVKNTYNTAVADFNKGYIGETTPASVAKPSTADPNSGPDTPADAMRFGLPLSTASGPPEKWTRSVDESNKTVNYAGPNGSGVSFVARNLNQDLPLQTYRDEIAGTRSSSGLDNEAIAMGNKNMAEGTTGAGSFSVVKMPTPEEVERRGDLEYYRKWRSMSPSERGGMDPGVADRLGMPHLGASRNQVRIIGDSSREGGDGTQADIRQAISSNLAQMRANSGGTWNWDSALKVAQARKNLDAIDGTYQQPQVAKDNGITAGDLVNAKRLEFDRNKHLEEQARQRELDNATMSKNLFERINANPPMGDAEAWMNGVETVARQFGVSPADAHLALSKAYNQSPYKTKDGLGETAPADAVNDLITKMLQQAQGQ